MQLYFKTPQGRGLSHAGHCAANYTLASSPPQYMACNCGAVRVPQPREAMRVAPGTDAVVWKPWDTPHEVCEL